MSSTQEVGEIFGEGSGPAQAMLRSPNVIIASIGLWGMNVFFFRLFGLDYVRILNLDLIKEQEEKAKAAGVTNDKEMENGTITVSDDNSDDHYPDSATTSFGGGCSRGGITSSKLVFLSISLLALLHSTTYVWMSLMGGGTIGAVLLFYTTVALGIAIPLPSTKWLRMSAVIVLQRAFELVNPRCSCVSPDPYGPRPIPFIDVFFADAMCSLSKVFFDWGMLWHLASHFPEPVPPSTHAILIPSICAAIPYLIRARQCLIMHTVGRIKNDPKKYQHMLNAIKYSTSIWPLCLSAYQQTITKEQAASLEPLLICLLAINALYSLAWDIIMDWGMMQDPTAVVGQACVVASPQQQKNSRSCHHAVLRPRLRFGVVMSTAILMTDTILRFGWTLRFYEALFPSKDAFVLFTQFLEVFRRAIWNLLRVEWEHIKQSKAGKNANEETASFVTAPSTISMVPLKINHNA
mmetsp:Transcript_11739/g.18198  ORF Transcript_11739/g.18198 Transcript_11739/m.18198 type:complete len:463 (-) Transcript_11739:66-1454(-)|eukprot:CAMPEP_0195307948 /NCGR_PEP_ID=MMETSP0707-20130614/37970_1 /TAXON_ID=33640 /ORGANISM="Asterionellopsis glacialis, Strain CCMP134" /LENGTH=462 /DNA_ID=CAMNT_0040372203 /DNA_START=199 /DNA_END=1587 /DNA_ORIENTATION=-